MISETVSGAEINASEILYENLNKLENLSCSNVRLPQIIAILGNGVNYSDPEINSVLWENPGELGGNGVDDDKNGWIDDTMAVDCTSADACNPYSSGNTSNDLIKGILFNGYPFELDRSGDNRFLGLKVLDRESKGYHSSILRAHEYLLSTFDLSKVCVTLVHHKWKDSAYSFAVAKSSLEKSSSAEGHDSVPRETAHNLTMGPGKMERVAAGSGRHILYIKDDGMVFGFGPNERGELGSWNWNYYGIGSHSPIYIASDAIQVSTAEDHTLIVKNDYSLWGSGFVNNGAIGNNTSIEFVELFRDVVCASAGRTHSLFVQSNGYLWGLGNAANGRLGIDSTANHPEPVFIASDVVSAATGGDTSFFIKSDGSLWGMGQNRYGELGDGTINPRITPVMIDTEVKSVSTGEFCSMYVKTDGTLWAMGSNRYYRMGQHPSSCTPFQVDDNVTEVSVGGSYYSAYLKNDGSLWVTGGHFGPLEPVEGMEWMAPTPIMQNVSHFAVGPGSSIIVVTNDGKVWLMGQTGTYYLSSGKTYHVGDPVQIDHLAADPDIFFPFEGVQLDDTTAWFLYTSNGSQVDGLKLMLADTSGDIRYYESAIDPVGTYQVLVNSLPSNGTEIKVDLQWLQGGVWNTTSRSYISKDFLPSTLDIAHTEFEAGDRRSYFIDDEKRLWAVGINPWGTLGANPDTRDNPVLFKAMDEVEKVIVGKRNTAFIRTDGTLWAVGSNQFHLVPGSGEGDQYTPVEANPGASAEKRNFVDAAIGNDHFMALRANGELVAIGSNCYGQLGDGTGMDKRYLKEVASGVTAVACGNHHTLFLRKDRSLWGVGRNEWGQLGTADNKNRYVPVKIAEDVTQIAVGGNQSYFIKSDGSLWGMGGNASGELGIGNQMLQWCPQSRLLKTFRQ